MMQNTLPALGASALLLLAAVLILLSGRAAERRLRERVLAARELEVKRGVVQDFRLDAPPSHGPFTQILQWLGYHPDLPPDYAPSLKFLLPVIGVIVLFTFRLASPLLGLAPSFLLAAIAGAATTKFVFARKNKAYAAILFRQIPDAMSLMLRAVRAGLPIAEAIRNVSKESMSPTKEEFARVSGEAALGVPVEIALQRLYLRTKLQEYAFFSVVIGLQGQTGGNLSEILENLADMVRRRVAMAGKARALAAEGRLSAIVVGALPFVVGVLISFVNPGYLAEFVTNPLGPTLIAVFVALLLCGIVSTHWLIQRSMQD